MDSRILEFRYIHWCKKGLLWAVSSGCTLFAHIIMFLSAGLKGLINVYDTFKSSFVLFSFQVVLERVLGLTSTNNASIACDPNTGTIAYPAG